MFGYIITRFVIMRFNISRRLILGLAVIFLFGCSGRKVPEGSLDYFRQNLKADMAIEEIEEMFGESEKSEYPALSVYKYQLIDSTQVWIGYTTKVVYACFVDKNHNLVEDLVPTEKSEISGL